MPAYVIVDLEVHDRDLMKQYREIGYPALEAFGGRAIARGAPEELDGEWNAKTVLIIEFPDMDKARGWFASDAYAPALAIRRKAATARVMLVPGL